MSALIASSLESEYKAYIRSLNLANLQANVFRMTDLNDPVTPVVVIVSGKSTELTINSGIYKVPLVIRVVCAASDLLNDPTGLDTLTKSVYASLPSAKDSINSTSTEIFIFSVTEPNAPTIELVETTFQYVISLEAVTKSKQ